MMVTSTTTAVGGVVGDHYTIITSSIIMMVTITITTAITIPHTDDDDDDDDKTQYVLMNEVCFLFSVHFFNTVCQNKIVIIHTSRCEIYRISTNLYYKGVCANTVYSELPGRVRNQG